MIGVAALLATTVTALLASRAAPLQPAATAPAFDVLIRNGRLLDGSGNPWVLGDVGVRDGRIAAVGRLGGAPATRTIDAAGLVVAPGFIDVHSHAGEGLDRLGLQQGQPLLAQGVTTIAINPDGGGPVDLAAQRAEFATLGLGVNVMPFIGHGSVRREVLGMADRAPTSEELERMKTLVARAMDEGAFGLSSGLFYAPGSYAATDEVIALMTVAGPRGGLHTSHIRDEGDYSIGVLAAVDEIIRIAEATGSVGIVSHMKALGPASWGLSMAAAMRIERARARGVQVFADQYPYEASSTSLVGALVPRWMQVGGQEQMRARLAEPGTRQRALVEVRDNIRRRGGPASLVIAFYAPERALEGQSLDQIAKARGVAPEHAVLDLLARRDASIVSFNMADRDIEYLMRQPWTMTSSDGGLVFPTEGKPHPRNYGAFARKLARYVRDREVVSLEFAVRSMTSLPARVFGLQDRGALREGAWADLVVFDPAEVQDQATYADPHQLAVGMRHVLVNGVEVVRSGGFTPALPGRVLRRDGR